MSIHYGSWDQEYTLRLVIHTHGYEACLSHTHDAWPYECLCVWGIYECMYVMVSLSRTSHTHTSHPRTSHTYTHTLGWGMSLSDTYHSYARDMAHHSVCMWWVCSYMYMWDHESAQTYTYGTKSLSIHLCMWYMWMCVCKCVFLPHKSHTYTHTIGWGMSLSHTYHSYEIHSSYQIVRMRWVCSHMYTWDRKSAQTYTHGTMSLSISLCMLHMCMYVCDVCVSHIHITRIHSRWWCVLQVRCSIWNMQHFCMQSTFLGCSATMMFLFVSDPSMYIFAAWYAIHSLLQCFAVFCSVLQCVAVCCSVLQCVAVCCSVLQCVAVCCSVLQSVAVPCALCCSVL